MRIIILMLLITGSPNLTGKEVVKPEVQSNPKQVLLRHLPTKNYFTSSDIQCTAETIYSEARGEPKIGKHAVGFTIVNRSTKIFHKRPCSIVKQQYTQKSIPKKDKQVFLSLAENVLLGKVSNPIGNMDSFDSFKDKPHKKGSIKIGNHFFYKALKIS